MFTGLINEIAQVKSFSNNTLHVKAKHKPKLGDSIAINGACLTVTQLQSDGFCVEVSSESQKYICVENLKDKVHMEPAMRLSDRLDGHFVQGHIDGRGEVEYVSNDGEFLHVKIKMSEELLKFMIPKGSVAIDGVSLTINEVYDDGIRLTLIPYTLKDTLLGEYKKGRMVNVESDMLIRSVFHMLNKKNGITWEEASRWAAMY